MDECNGFLIFGMLLVILGGSVLIAIILHILFSYFTPILVWTFISLVILIIGILFLVYANKSNK